jgi:chromosome segregation ATPase
MKKMYLSADNENGYIGVFVHPDHPENDLKDNGLYVSSDAAKAGSNALSEIIDKYESLSSDYAELKAKLEKSDASCAELKAKLEKSDAELQSAKKALTDAKTTPKK